MPKVAALIIVAMLASVAVAENAPDYTRYDKDTLIAVIKGQQERITLLEHETKDLRGQVTRLKRITSGKSASSFDAKPQAFAAPVKAEMVAGNLAGVPADVRAKWRASWEDGLKQRKHRLAEAEQVLANADTTIEGRVASAERGVRNAQSAIDEWMAKENTFSLSLDGLNRPYGNFAGVGIKRILDADTMLVSGGSTSMPYYVDSVDTTGSNEQIRTRLRDTIFHVTGKTTYTGEDGNSYEALLTVPVN